METLTRHGPVVVDLTLDDTPMEDADLPVSSLSFAMLAI